MKAENILETEPPINSDQTPRPGVNQLTNGYLDDYGGHDLSSSKDNYWHSQGRNPQRDPPCCKHSLDNPNRFGRFFSSNQDPTTHSASSKVNSHNLMMMMTLSSSLVF